MTSNTAVSSGIHTILPLRSSSRHCDRPCFERTFNDTNKSIKKTSRSNALDLRTVASYPIAGNFACMHTQGTHYVLSITSSAMSWRPLPALIEAHYKIKRSMREWKNDAGGNEKQVFTLSGLTNQNTGTCVFVAELSRKLTLLKLLLATQFFSPATY